MTIKSGKLDGAEGWIVREQKLLAEVEKWKEAAIKADGSRVAAIARADAAEAERDALRAEVAELKRRRIVYNPDAKALSDRCEAAEAEAKRVNRALVRCADDRIDAMRKLDAAEAALATAREALEIVEPQFTLFDPDTRKTLRSALETINKAMEK